MLHCQSSTGRLFRSWGPATAKRLLRWRVCVGVLGGNQYLNESAGRNDESHLYHVTSSASSSLLSASITPSLFHSTLNTFSFTNHSLHRSPLTERILGYFTVSYICSSVYFFFIFFSLWVNTSVSVLVLLFFPLIIDYSCVYWFVDLFISIIFSNLSYF